MSRSSAMGKSRSRRTWIIVPPTSPVAPTTATVSGWRVIRGTPPLRGSRAPFEYNSVPGASRPRVLPQLSRGRAGTPSEGPTRRDDEWVPGGCDVLAGKPASWLGSDGFLGEVALHGRLARQVDPALAVDFGDDNHHLVAYRDHILDSRDVVVGQLADPDEA